MLPIWWAAGLLEPQINLIAGLITLEIVKKHLRIEVDETEGDDLISLYVETALAHLDGRDGWLGRALRTQTFVETFDRFDRLRRLPYPPIVEVQKVERFDGSAWVELPTAGWSVDDGGLTPLPGTSWPAGPARVTYTAGYDASAERPLPRPIMAAILLMVDDLYRNRGEVVSGTITSRVDMAPSVQALLSPFRMWRV